MNANEELKKYTTPALDWIERHLKDAKLTETEKKKLVLLREFIKEQNENSHPSAR